MVILAWQLFGTTVPGWARVQRVCDFVHRHLKFDYLQARNTRTAYEAYRERVGVCRDFTHLAVTLCRCLNIPARYCAGYLGDIRVPAVPDPMDFSAWFEVYLGDRWHTFDARHNVPRVGRVLMARGRDAADVALLTSFGSSRLERFTVWCNEVGDEDCCACNADPKARTVTTEECEYRMTRSPWQTGRAGSRRHSGVARSCAASESASSAPRNWV